SNTRLTVLRSGGGKAATSLSHPAPSSLRRSKCDLLLRVVVDDLALGGLLEGHRQVILRAGLDQRRRELVERALAELVVVVVDLPRALGGDDHERIARVDLVQQLVDAGMNHGCAMVAAPSKHCATIAASSSAARTLSSLRTTKS